jgi:GntR family transcriptional regulator/MocR family aminotransferase
MAISGTTSPASPELLLPRWDPAAPRRAQLEAGLRESIRGGRLRPGVRLPSSRALGAELGVSRRLVVETYEQLAAEGYLVSSRGSGTRVAPATPADSPSSDPTSAGGGTHARAAGEPTPNAATVPRAAAAPAVAAIDLFPGSPDLSLFPRRAWGRALRRALAELPDARLGYGEFSGTSELRDALAEHLGRVRAAAAEPGRIVVTAGYQQGLRIFTSLLRERGVRRVAVEDPGYPVAAWTLESEGLEVVPVPVDDEGLDVEALIAANPDPVIVTPAHSLPAGAVLAWSWRTTTTPSFATTVAAPPGRCRASPPMSSSSPAASPRPLPPPCAWPGSAYRPRWSPRRPSPAACSTAAARGSRSWPSPS